MNKQETQKEFVPKLRFPEFRDAGEWEAAVVGKVAKYENGKAHEQDIAETGDFIVVNSKFISTDGEVKKFTNTPFCPAEKGDILMVLSDVPNGRAIAKCFFVDTNNLYTVNQRICKITPSKAFGLMLFYTLNRNPYLLAFDDGVKQTNLKNEDVLNCPILLPKDQKEQQKIAECLFTIDELIDAENQKLVHMNKEKTGLLQQLFPAEGKKIPELRFPEFKDAGEWKEKSLETIAEFLKGKGISKSDITPSGALPCIRYGELYTHYSEIITNVLSYTDVPSENLVLSEINDVIIPSSGETKEDIATASCVMESGIALGGDLNIIRSKVNGVFLAYYLSYAKKSAISKLAQGDTVVHLYNSQLQKLIVNLPSLQEQQKIADCLSSLDELIAIQSKKLETMKEHKKGLMQQLFPSPNK